VPGSHHPDVVVVGGGVIGMMAAARLAADGRKVVLLEGGEQGRDSSGAAAGALAVVRPHAMPPPLHALAARSLARWPQVAGELETCTGRSAGLGQVGLLRLVLDGGMDDEAGAVEAWRTARGLPTERLDSATLRAFLPEANPLVKRALYEPDALHVRMADLDAVLRAAIARRGGRVVGRVPATGLERSGGRVRGVVTREGTFSCAEVVLAAGAWSSALVKPLCGGAVSIRPVRGQRLQLQVARPFARRPLIVGPGYRYVLSDGKGRCQAGTTFEDAGFDGGSTVEGVLSILQAAVQMLPPLKEARLIHAGSGLRPETADGLPCLGRFLGLEGLLFAAGHGSHGVLLAPATADAIGDLVAGRTPDVDLRPFAPHRTCSSKETR